MQFKQNQGTLCLAKNEWQSQINLQIIRNETPV